MNILENKGALYQKKGMYGAQDLKFSTSGEGSWTEKLTGMVMTASLFKISIHAAYLNKIVSKKKTAI